MPWIGGRALTIMMLVWFCACFFLHVITAATLYPDTCQVKRNQILCIGDGNSSLPNVYYWNKKNVIFKNYTLSERTLSASHIRSSKKTQRLTLTKVGIERIEPGIFSVLRNLKFLSITENDLKELKEKTFGRLHNLKDLNLSANHLENIDGAFSSSSKLRLLDLSFNRLREITNRTFARLEEAHQIYLDDNQISRIEPTAFNRISLVTHLSLSKNPLTNVKYLSLPRKLHILSLSSIGFDKIHAIPWPIKVNSHVTTLILSGNNFTKVTPRDVAKLKASYPFIRRLTLDHNRIRLIKENSFDVLRPSLIELDLNHNQLKTIPLGFPTTLTHLFLSSNQIKGVKDNSLNYPNLNHLSLQRNKIRALSNCAFCNLSKLEYLNLKNNRIMVLKGNVFQNLTSLTYLELSNNPIKQMKSGCFNGLKSVVYLDLSHIPYNVSYHEDIFRPLKNPVDLILSESPKLTKRLLYSEVLFKYFDRIANLDISHNKLETLPRNISVVSPDGFIIDLSFNKWHCNQSSLWFSEWMNSPTVLFLYKNDVVCSTPKRQAGKQIKLLTSNDF